MGCCVRLENTSQRASLVSPPFSEFLATLGGNTNKYKPPNKISFSKFLLLFFRVVWSSLDICQSLQARQNKYGGRGARVVGTGAITSVFYSLRCPFENQLHYPR